MESAWDGDWDSLAIDTSTQRAQVDPNAELRPVSVDESLTDLLFATHATPQPKPPASRPVMVVPERVSEPIWVDMQEALFEAV